MLDETYSGHDASEQTISMIDKDPSTRSPAQRRASVAVIQQAGFGTETPWLEYALWKRGTDSVHQRKHHRHSSVQRRAVDDVGHERDVVAACTDQHQATAALCHRPSSG
jgi:hypothetical protein